MGGHVALLGWCTCGGRGSSGPRPQASCHSAAQLRMVYGKRQSEGLTPGPGWHLRNLGPGPRRHGSSLLAGQLAGWLAVEAVALSAGSLSPVLSHSGPWLVWGRLW